MLCGYHTAEAMECLQTYTEHHLVGVVRAAYTTAIQNKRMVLTSTDIRDAVRS